MTINIPEDSDFTLDNLPFGIFSCGGHRRVGVAIGEHIFDLTSAVDAGWFPEVSRRAMHTGYLNEFIAMGKRLTNGVRNKLRKIFKSGDHSLTFFVLQKEAKMHLPVFIGDYTDFYSSEEHAINVGKLYRDPENALMPNWKHMPVGYHGRASSIVISGTDVHRPQGQTKKSNDEYPSFGPTKALDFELELGFIIGKETSLGDLVSTEEANEYIFGMVLLNDWSARDIQKWEYAPLGPFLGKNFATSISPWVVPYEALDFFRVAGPLQDPEVLDYLRYEGEKNIDIKLSVALNGEVVSESNFKYMYWNMEQQLAHHTVNGCNVRVGDIMGSGTISGKEEFSYGSMLELSQGGRKEISLSEGKSRTFLEDGDEVLITGFCEKEGRRIGFGSVSGIILPSKIKTNEEGN